MKTLVRTILVSVLVLSLLLAIGPATQAKSLGKVVSQFYGTTADGLDVFEYTLTNAAKRPMEVKIITYGGIITSIKFPDKWGNSENVVWLQ